MIRIAGDFAAAGVAVGLARIEAEVAVGPAGDGLAAGLAAAVSASADWLAHQRPQDVPAVAATRAAYKALGKDPARYRPAAEALLRRVAQGKGVAPINAVVDVNNLLSLETGFSIGVYDLAKLEPPLVFRRGRPGESYEGIGRGPLNLEGLPVFADAAGPFGSPTSDSRRSLVDATTRRIVMVLIGFAPVPVTQTHLARACELLEAHARGRVLTAELVDGG